MQILRNTNLEAYRKMEEMSQEEVLEMVDEKGLVGRGGAGFPTARKWRMALEQEDETYLVINADEGEPGTFKDRFIMKHNPETFIEGVIITSRILDVEKTYIYLRGEYEYLEEELLETFRETMEELGIEMDLEIVMGAGAYVCGEETAILESIMGNRGTSMRKPPYPTVEGLWDSPTVVNNVETITCVPQLILYDDWNPDLRLFSLSGNVSNPGLFEAPLGVKVSTLIDLARPEKELKAMSLGNFGGIMPIDESMEITPELISDENCFHGTYSLIWIDETNSIADVCQNIAEFYTYESCGKCTPCREGSKKILDLLVKINEGKGSGNDLEELEELAEHVNSTSLCGLGKTVGKHVLTALEHFREDFEERLV